MIFSLKLSQQYNAKIFYKELLFGDLKLIGEKNIHLNKALVIMDYFGY